MNESVTPPTNEQSRAELDPFVSAPLYDRRAVPPRLTSSAYYKNWFSNFVEFETPLVEDGISYKTPEHYFQALKLASESDRRKLSLMSAGQAKVASREMALRPEAQNDAFLEATMERALRHKFAPGTKAFSRLMATGREEIVEWTNWGDRRFGRDIATDSGENRLGVHLMRLREEYRAQGLTATVPLTAGVEQRPDRVTKWYAGIGSTKIDPNSEEGRLAAALAKRLERLGYGLRSGGARGADTIFGARLSPAMKDIYRPVGDEQKRLPPGYRIIHGDNENEAPREALALAERLHPAWEHCDDYVRNLHARNAHIVLGADLQDPVEFVLAIKHLKGGEVTGGTKMGVDIARERAIPVYNLTVREDVEQILARIAEMERVAGITHKGPALAAPAPALRATFPVRLEGLDPTSARPIRLSVLNVRDLPPPVRDDVRDRAPDTPRDNIIYVGRNEESAQEHGLRFMPALGNPFVVGKHGMRGECAELHRDLIAKKLEKKDPFLEKTLGQLAEQAATKGVLGLACHCAPHACHAETYVAVIGNRLRNLGFTVNDNLTATRRESAMPMPAIERSAIDAMVHDGVALDAVQRVDTPWRSARGTLRALDEEQQLAYLDLGEGQYRVISAERFVGDLPPVGQVIDLKQDANGVYCADMEQTADLVHTISREGAFSR